MHIETDILIVGTGQAGAQAAITLRQQGFAGRILMVGEEDSLPYERPPLSKDYLAGKKPAERLLLRPAAFWTERRIEIRPDTAITSATGHGATAADGTSFGFATLIWAAGGHARRLSCPGADLPGIHMLRTRADADRLLAALPGAGHVLVVGGGFVGLETAATLRGHGKQVTVVEIQPRLLARTSAPPVSAFYLVRHRAHGVEVHLGTAVLEFAGTTRVEGAWLDDGRYIAADLVVAGVGLVPAIAPLGLDVLDVDGHCRTSLAGVYAAGDCARHSNRFTAGRHTRIESVQNAVDMAKAAAGHIVHGDAAAPYGSCPWFWSNQYDLRLQTIGHAPGYEQTVVRGDPDSGKWSLVYLRGGAVVAIDCINNARDYVQGRALVERGAQIDPARLADAAIPLRDMAAQAGGA